ncbi:MAG: LpqB family beta-propeller domain-containing protein [Actinomycetales bacterium]
MRRELRARALAAVVVLVLGLCGCAAIPTSGPVGKSDPLPVTDTPVNFGFRQNPPAKGADPSSIVQGFVQSGTGIQDDFQVARQYLSKAAGQSWKSDARTLVYKNDFKITSAVEGPDGTATVQADFTVQSVVDDAGIMTPAAAGRVDTIKFGLVQVDGQWRIDTVPDGIMLQSSNFSQLFTSYPLYFYDPTFTYAVPDVRWISNKTQTTATQIVKAILNGPAPYLKGAVASAFPDGMNLVRDSVPITNGVAQVDLAPQPLLDATVKARQQMQAQLQLTLQLDLNTVTSVTLRADTRTVEVTGGPDPVPPVPIANNQVPDRQVAVSKGTLVGYTTGQVSAIDGMPDLSALKPAHPAMSYSKQLFAFLSQDSNQLYSVAPGQAAQLVAAGSRFTPPSFSPQDWLWTAAGDGSGAVLAVHAGASKEAAAPVQLNIRWLAGRTVTSLRISRDGCRVLVVSELNGVSLVQLAGITSTDGTPKDFTTPLTLSTTGTATEGVWVNETTVAVMEPASSGSTVVELLSLRGDPIQLAPLSRVQTISAGNTVLDIYAQTDNAIYLRTGNGWSQQIKSVQDASYAG